MDRAKLAALLLAGGLLVGVVVAAASAGTSLALCGGGSQGERCRALVLTLATRAGVVSGVVVVLMGLLVAGMLKTLTQREDQRRTRDIEAYLAAPDGVETAE